MAGAPRVAPNGERLSGTYKQTYCVYRLSLGAVSELELAIAASLEQLRPRSLIFKKIVADGGRCELFIGIFLLRSNAGIELPPALLSVAAGLGIALSFDIYGPDASPSTSM
jgi:hypothetical protein